MRHGLSREPEAFQHLGVWRRGVLCDRGVRPPRRPWGEYNNGFHASGDVSFLWRWLILQPNAALIECLQVNFHGDYRLVMGLACVWLLWAVLLWGWAGRIMRRRQSSLAASLQRDDAMA
jgi:hypothetical protein